MRYLKTKWVVVIVVMVLLACIAGYVLALRSDAYERANGFVMTSPFIRQQLGDVRKMRLHPFGFSIRVSGVSGRAEFSCSLEGTQGNGELAVTLLKEVGVWRVSAATLNGQSVPALKDDKGPA